ncbi:MAG: cytochrome d ubiquinol oxidase subunit II, partial [Pseudomonadota bacterium]
GVSAASEAAGNTEDDPWENLTVSGRFGRSFLLVFRGVAFEFYWRTHRARFLWDWAFTLGSVTATLAQGIALGALVQGIHIENRTYAGGWWDWLTPFSIVTGIALLFGYALLGATWLIMKTGDSLQNRAYQLAWPTGLVTLFAIFLVSFWMLFLDPTYMARWFSWPAMLYVIPVPLLVAACAWKLFRNLQARQEIRPFLASICLFILCYVGLIISFFPKIVPPSITIWDAAAPDKSLSFLLAGTIVLLPMILGYTTYAYWVFRGKVDPAANHH